MGGVCVGVHLYMHVHVRTWVCMCPSQCVSCVHMYACVNVVCAVPLTPGLEEAQCVHVALSLDVPQLWHARGEETLRDPPPVEQAELQLHVG